MIEAYEDYGEVHLPKSCSDDPYQGTFPPSGLDKDQYTLTQYCKQRGIPIQGGQFILHPWGMPEGCIQYDLEEKVKPEETYDLPIMGEDEVV